ncbi:polysaccharide lyase family 8 super-sandwich domain-containing protein [Paenibacillus sp. YN15]|uniref:polysaccharide lyase family 8 super-sandwich domain-containing protein n=1 Tax=Paenibacillus sp. YN15 TaxID=1742774 RepID=UPI0015EB48AB|nr:polysaccharide lyase family 8 super-sandwich domain-containing protein [Paenibacillus sp. YN15]
MIKRVCLLVVICMMAGMWAGVVPSAKADGSSGAGQNLIPNSGFEETVTNSAWLNGTAPADWGVWFATAGGVVSVDQAVYHSGQASVKIDQTKQSRTNVSVNGGVTVQPGSNYKLGIWMKTDRVTSSSGVIFRTYYYNGNAKIDNGPTATVKGTTDWTLKELFLSVPSTANNVRVEIMFETGTGVVWVDDASFVQFDGLTGISLPDSFLELQMGGQIRLTPVLQPANAADKTVVWSSSNPTVAEVVYGTVTALSLGETVIRAATPDSALYAECTVVVEDPADMAAAAELRLRWYDRLTGNSLYNPDDPDMEETVLNAVYQITNPEGTGRWDTLNRAANRTYLWQDNSSATVSAQLSNTFGLVKNMALAYSYIGSPLYHNAQLRDDILSALDWLYTYRYNENIAKIYDNWYHWEISIPKALGDTMVLMYDELGPERIAGYIRAIDRFVPDPVKRKSLNDDFRETGANLLDKAVAVTVRGIVGQSPYKIVQGSAAIGPEYIYTKSGDGVYEDGSLVQHFNIAYTGGYGSVWLNNTADIMYLLKGSKWEVSDPHMNNVFNWVSSTFEPVIYKGLMMDIVNGRGMSREGSGKAKATILCILRLAQSAPAGQALEMKRMVKEWFLADTTVDNPYTGLSLYDMVLLKAIMDNPEIEPRGELVKSQVFAGMDRVVNLREGYAFATAMFSDQISAFEFGNGENLKGWYTGMGMTYLYNNDLTQYLDDFWPTVDSYRLAGTTTDGSYQAPVAWASYYNPRSWVGGVTMDGLYSGAGMDFSLSGSTGSSLAGKKSWFAFDDEIVAVGSGITGGDGRTVETIVENRKLSGDNSNVLTVNGAVKDGALGWSETMEATQWAHLTGNGEGTDIGYVFPEAPAVDALREARTGAWKDINTTQSDTPRTRNYLSLAFNHGANPQNAEYSYVLLPGKNAAATADYSAQPDVQVLSGSNAVHAVKESKLGLTAANFWEAGTVAGITADQPAAVMVRESSDGTVKVSVSDPTQQQTSVGIGLAREGLELVKKDEGVEVTVDADGVHLTAATAGAAGHSFTAVFKSAAAGGGGEDGGNNGGGSENGNGEESGSGNESGNGGESGSGSEPGNGAENGSGSGSGSESGSADGDSSTSAPSGAAAATLLGQGQIAAQPLAEEGTAATKVEAALLEQAFGQAPADPAGVKEVVIRVAELAGADRYMLELPAAAFTSGGADRHIRVEIPGVELTLPSNLLEGQSIDAPVRLSISKIVPETADPHLASVMGQRPAVELSLQAGGKALSWRSGWSPVRVALDYKPAAAEQSELGYLGVYALSGEGQAAPVPSGRYDADEQGIVFRPARLGTFAVVLAEARGFPDLGGYLWAQEAAEVLAAKGLFEGGTDGQFAPGAALTRADLALLLTRLLQPADATAAAAEPFADVSPSAYYYEALGQARAAGWIEGRENNRFAPGEAVSRQEMLALLYRATEGGQLLKGQAASAPANGDGEPLSAFADSAQLADYALEAAAAFTAAGLVEGDGGQLRPLDPVTRAEAAVLLYRIYRQL